MKRFTGLLLLSLVLVTPGWAQLSPDQTERVLQLVRTTMRDETIPGLSLAVGRSDEVIFDEAFGLADLENNIPATPQTVYRTASLAKPITAVAVMQLAEKGSLDLDASIQKYCPEYPLKEWPLTSRHLLGHLGGVRHYNRPGESRGTEFFSTLKASIHLFKDDPLLHEPGTKYSYTTYGYTLLGCAIENTAGTDYENYVETHLFGPAGMLQSDVDTHYVLIPHRARGYMLIDQETYAELPEPLKRKTHPGDLVNAHLHDTSMKVAGGGLVSTPDDLVRFAMAVDSGKLLSSESVRAMWTKQKLAGGEETSYGLGWGIREVEGRRVISHSGSQAGTGTYLLVLPDDDIYIAVMANLTGVGLSELAHSIAKILVE